MHSTSTPCLTLRKINPSPGKHICEETFRKGSYSRHISSPLLGIKIRSTKHECVNVTMLTMQSCFTPLYYVLKTSIIWFFPGLFFLFKTINIKYTNICEQTIQLKKQKGSLCQTRISKWWAFTNIFCEKEKILLYADYKLFIITSAWLVVMKMVFQGKTLA